MAAGSTCTVNVTFAPKFAGARSGAVQIVDNSGNVLASTAIYGTGTASAIAYSPSTTVTLASGFSTPEGVAVDGAGNVFITDSRNSAVKEIVAEGDYTTVRTLNSDFNFPFGVAVDGEGNVFVADSRNNAVKEIVAEGGYTTVLTLGSGFSSPTGISTSFVEVSGSGTTEDCTGSFSLAPGAS